jgi:hypothetical protein
MWETRNGGDSTASEEKGEREREGRWLGLARSFDPATAAPARGTSKNQTAPSSASKARK